MRSEWIDLRFQLIVSLKSLKWCSTRLMFGWSSSSMSIFETELMLMMMEWMFYCSRARTLNGKMLRPNGMAGQTIILIRFVYALAELNENLNAVMLNTIWLKSFSFSNSLRVRVHADQWNDVRPDECECEWEYDRFTISFRFIDTFDGNAELFELKGALSPQILRRLCFGFSKACVQIWWSLRLTWFREAFIQPLTAVQNNRTRRWMFQLAQMSIAAPAWCCWRCCCGVAVSEIRRSR